MQLVEDFLAGDVEILETIVVLPVISRASIRTTEQGWFANRDEQCPVPDIARSGFVQGSQF
jgi:hypothetical protein